MCEIYLGLPVSTKLPGFTVGVVMPETQRTHDVIIMSLLRQNDVVTSFCCNNDVIIASCVHWGPCILLITAYYD